MIRTPPDEPESEEEFEMNDDDVTLCEEWGIPDQLPPGTDRVNSIGLASIQEQEAREETLRRLSHDVLGNSSDSPKASIRGRE
jgi:hypothetical protein